MKKLFLAFAAILLAIPAWPQNLTVPAGTALTVTLDRTLTTFSSKPGDVFSGHIKQALVLDGKTVIPAGATVEGKVTKVSEPRRIAGKPTIGIRPQAVILPNGQRLAFDATLVDTNLRGTDVNEEGQFKGSGRDRKDTTEIAAGTGGGMLAGGLIGGGPGVLIGGAVGAGATAVHWFARHKSAMIPAGTELVMELNRPMTVVAESGGQ